MTDERRSGLARRARRSLARAMGRYSAEKARIDEAAARENARPLSSAVTRLARGPEEGERG